MGVSPATYFSKRVSSPASWAASATFSIITSRQCWASAEQLGGDLDDLELGAERLVQVAHGLHLDEVDDALRASPPAPSGSWIATADFAAQALVHRLDRVEEVGAHAVHLVDERDARDLVLVGLAPDGLGLGLDARDRVEDRDRAVEHAQRALDLGREVDVARACR